MTSKYALMPRLTTCSYMGHRQDDGIAISWDEMQGNDRVWNIYASDDNGEGLSRIGIIYSAQGANMFRAEFNHASECPAALRGIIAPEPFVSPEQLDEDKKPQPGGELRSLALAYAWVRSSLVSQGVEIRVPGVNHQPF